MRDFNSVTQPTSPLFSASYTYRKPSVLAIGALLSTVCGYSLFLFSYPFKRPSGLKEIFAFLFVASILLILFSCGCFFLHAFFTRHALHLKIAKEGISYSKKFIPWSRVRWISGYFHHSRYQLVVGLRGLSADYHLMTDEGLSEEDYDALIARLRTLLQEDNPEINIG